MTAANDRTNRTAPAWRDQMAELSELAAEYAPRRFALCWLDPDDDDGGILAWGLAPPFGKVVLTGENGHVLGSFSSSETARGMFAHKNEVVLVWLDEPAQFADAEPETAGDAVRPSTPRS